MRSFDPLLQAALESGSTTLCRCVRIIRKDGVTLGFTDHDASLTFNGTTFEPADGFEASEESAALGPAASEWDMRAALTDARLTDADLMSGCYDEARVETFLVDWQDPSTNAILSTGTLGDVSRRDGAFHAEVRGPFAAFDRVRGRVFGARCDAELGDSRCGVALDDAAYSATGTVLDVPAPHIVELDGLDAYAAGHFTGGTIQVDGHAPMRVRSHGYDGSKTTLTLWRAPEIPLAMGAAIIVRAGCDKSFATCKAKFANTVNFRGFPHMPGDDFALSYPNRSDGNLDGGSLS
ncbi:MAG: DUF2163 domain-containing protein [Pseudomonadota bacterium]